MTCIPPGEGLAYHVDTHSAFEDYIAAVTLQSGSVMGFRHADGRVKQVYLPPRSLVIMQGEARYGWEHTIPARRNDVVDGKAVPRGIRVSATYRRVTGVVPCVA